MSFPESTPYPESSQASTALVISIVGLVCCQVLGIVAWVMAHNELEAIKAGRRNPVNEGTATARDIRALVRLCQRRVAEAFGVNLKEEIVSLGDFDEE